MATITVNANIAGDTPERHKGGDKPARAATVKLPAEAAATKGTRHLLFGNGPFLYRLLRWSQRNRR